MAERLPGGNLSAFLTHIISLNWLFFVTLVPNFTNSNYNYMGRLLLSIFLFALAFQSHAALDGDGYYRVRNYQTNRYVYVVDDKGRISYHATDIDLGALYLYSGFDYAVNDPACIIYITDLTGSKRDYDLQTQGTGVKTIIDHAVSIRLANSSRGTYNIFGRDSGTSKYIADTYDDSAFEAWGLCKAGDSSTSTLAHWYIEPVSETGDNYFGIKGEFKDGNDYYSTIYAGFPFSTYSDGMTLYAVTSVNDGTAYIDEVEGTVPMGTPLIVKTSSVDPSSNRLSLGGTGTAVDGNMLSGAYFCSSKLNHVNRVANDKATMRVLGKLSDGSVGFVTSTETYLPRNKAYLVVPAGTPAELKIDLASNAAIGTVWADGCDTAIELDGLTLTVSGTAPWNVYSVTGQPVAGGSESGSVQLPAPGIYIVKAGNTVRKILAH